MSISGVQQKVYKAFLSKDLFWLVLAGLGFVAVAAIASYRSMVLPIRIFDGVEWTGYNNFLIFKHAYYHLIEQLDLYKLYPQVHGDLYKYSPTFAWFMGWLGWLPDWLGLFLWNLLNSVVLFFALKRIPLFKSHQNAFAMLYVGVELLTAAHNDQANALIAGLLIYAFMFVEEDKPYLAALCIVSTVFIKLFGIVALLLIVFAKRKVRFTVACIFWTAVFALVPLIVISPEYLMSQYDSWLELLLADYAGPIGLSVSNGLQMWFDFFVPNWIVVGLGALILVMPLAQRSKYNRYGFRVDLLASMLIWVIIFNHKAEGATFIIAMTGVALWFFNQRLTWPNVVLIVLALIFTSFVDRRGIFPEAWRLEELRIYVVKAVPCILIWLKIQYDLMTKNYLPEGHS